MIGSGKQSWRTRGLVFVALLGLNRAESIAQLNQELPQRANAQKIDASKRLDELNRRMEAEAAAGRNAEALTIAQQMLKEVLRSYPQSKYPNGSEDLASAITRVAVLQERIPDYEAAEKNFLLAQEMRGKLYPGKNGIVVHPLLAMGHEALGSLYFKTGRYAESAQRYEEALLMWRRGYPKSRYPNGHEKITGALRGAADSYFRMEQFDRAMLLLREDLAMERALHPPEQFPRGDATIISALIRISDAHHGAGRLDEAFTAASEAVAMARAIYTPIQFPDGHELLSRSIVSLAAVQQKRAGGDAVLGLYEELLGLQFKQYPAAKYPAGHANLSTTMKVLALIYQGKGRWLDAFQLHEYSLQMDFALYPAKSFPKGHEMLLSSINNLGFYFRMQGKYSQALPYYDRAYDMARDLYGELETPQAIGEVSRYEAILGQAYSAVGNFDRSRTYYQLALESERKRLAKSERPEDRKAVLHALASLGYCYKLMGDLDNALAYQRQALALADEIFDFGEYPLGDYSQKILRNDLASIQHSQGKSAEAAAEFEKVLAEMRGEYVEGEFPRGHIDLVAALHNVAISKHAAGDADAANASFAAAFEMYAKMFPPDSFPHGHANWARTLREFGRFRLAQGDAPGAKESLRRAAEMELALLESHIRLQGQQSTNYQLDYPAAGETIDLLLAATSGSAGDEFDPYPFVYRWKRGPRQEAQDALDLHTLNANPELEQDFADYYVNRANIAKLNLFNSFDRDPDNWSRIDKMLAALNQHQASLQSRLEERSEAFRVERAALKASSVEFSEKLPDNTALVDFVRYAKGAARNAPASYAAFVLRSGRGAERVELGDAEAADKAIAQWRSAIRASKSGDGDAVDAAARLRALVWAPIDERLQDAVDKLILVPTGKLSAIPWGALPGRAPNSVLLEDYVVSLAPDAPFVYERRLAPDSAPGGSVLLVGDVRYGDAPASPAVVLSVDLVERAPLIGRQKWPKLPGAAMEMAQIKRLAGDLPVREVRGTSATTSAMIEHFSGARYLHLSTYGYYSDPAILSRSAVSARALRNEAGAAEIGQIDWFCGRNPLAMSGLVLAGASQRPRADALGVPLGDRGILTSEAILFTNLHDSELCYLSAGDTGVGDASGGEGALGLVRALHLAGARNVVATLWEPDAAARLIMVSAFYRSLWSGRRSPVDAHREAQLFVFRHPKLLASLRTTLSQAEGPDRDVAIDNLLSAISLNDQVDGSERSPVHEWGANLISGY